MDESRDLLADDQSKVKQRVVQRLVFTFTVDKISSLRYSVSDENRRRPLLLLLLLLSAFNSARSGKAANVLGNSYKWSRNVLSLFLNVASEMSGVRSSAGRLFHTRAPWTAKLRSL